MIIWLKNLFKEKHCVYINLNESFFNNKKIICYGELFKQTGIDFYIKELQKASKINKYHYKNIQASKETIKNIEDFMKNNLFTTKNKWSRIYSNKKLSSIFSFDCLMYAPYENNKIPINKIKILLPGNKNFIYVTEEEI